MKYLLSILCLFVFVLASNVCDALYYDFEHSLKVIALSNADEIGDNSAPRQNNRLLERNTEYLKMSMYLTLMKENVCHIRNLNWDWNKYYMNALQYKMAQVKGNWDCLPDCFIDNWSGNLELDILEDPDGIPLLTAQKGIDCKTAWCTADGGCQALCTDSTGRHTIAVGDSIGGGILTDIVKSGPYEMISKILIYKDDEELIFDVSY